MYKALYREYRPETFDQVLGQKHIIKILENQIEAGTVSHAYLFCGTRGTGKTTTARLLAKGVNCLAEGNRPCGECENCIAIKEGRFIDIVELDAASNNKVENIRELIENIQYAPAKGRKKVYIIDEVHMLSTSAFNAFLKTLEEPPEYAMFILATTDPNKLPATVLSRCIRMDFRRVPEKELIDAMGNICAKQGVDITEDALGLVATNADGSARDGLTILEQCISGRSETITRDKVLETLGAISDEAYIKLTDLVLSNKFSDGLIFLEQILNEGKDPRQIISGWMSHYRNLLMVKFVKKPEDILNMSLENIERLREQANTIDLSEINQGINELAEAMISAKNSTQPRILLELALIKLGSKQFQQDVAAARQMPAARPAVEPASPSGDRQSEGAKVASSQGTGKPASKPSAPNKAILEEIWTQILEEGCDRQPSFGMLSNRARIVKVDEREFVVEVIPGARTYLESNTALVEELFTKYYGKKLTIRILIHGEALEEKPKANLEEIKQQAENFLGIEIEQE